MGLGLLPTDCREIPSAARRSSGITKGFASNRYGMAMLARASQQQVVNVAQHGGICAVMVGAAALHTREFRIPTGAGAERSS